MSAQQKVLKFVADQLSIDGLFDLSLAKFQDDRDAYDMAWEDYLKMTARCAEDFKKSLGYFKSLSLQESQVEKYEVSSSHMKLGSARTYIARARSYFSKMTFYPHFVNELQALRAKYQEYDSHFNSLDISAPDHFHHSIGILVKHGVPRKITDDLNLLPYRHPVLRTLRLSSQQYSDLVKRARSDKLESHRNVPIAKLSGIRDVVLTSYQNIESDPNDYSTPVVILALAIGRRFVEIALKSKITKSSVPGHVRISDLAKRSKKSAIDIPVVLLSPIQVLKVFKIARERIENVAFAGKKRELKRIQDTMDTKAFSDAMKPVRTRFKSMFNFERLEKSSKLRATATMHSASRAIYQYLVVKMFSSHPAYLNLSPIEIANRVLGHEEGDYNVTLSYFDLNLIDDIPDIRQPETPAPPAMKQTVSAPLSSGRGATKQTSPATMNSAPQSQKRLAQENKKIWARICAGETMLKLSKWSVDKRNPAVIKVHMTVVSKYKSVPSFSDLCDIAGEPAARSYISFLESIGIKGILC